MSRPWTREEALEAFKMRKNDMTHADIGLALDRKPNAVRNYLRRHDPNYNPVRVCYRRIRKIKTVCCESPLIEDMDVRQNDADFVRAMRSAISLGHEKVREGFYKSRPTDYVRIINPISRPATQSVFAELAAIGGIEW